MIIFEKTMPLILKKFHENVVLKPPVSRKLSHYPEMQNEKWYSDASSGFNPYSAGVDFSRHNMTSSCRRQILTTKVDARTVTVNLFTTVADP